MDIRNIDQAAFNARAAELLEGLVTRVEAGRIWNFADLGSAFISEEERAARPDRWILDLCVKTSRAPSGYDECDGTTPPAKAADAVAEQLAAEFGLRSRGYTYCEKGWGQYSFEAPRTQEQVQAQFKCDLTSAVKYLTDHHGSVGYRFYWSHQPSADDQALTEDEVLAQLSDDGPRPYLHGYDANGETTTWIGMSL
jgi:hypothetical protein